MNTLKLCYRNRSAYKDMYTSKILYIHQNAVKAGLVEYAEDYLLSSARDYAGKKGLVKISFL